MTIENLKFRLQNYKRDNARLKLLKLRVKKSKELSIDYDEVINDLEYKVLEVEILLSSLNEIDRNFVQYKFIEEFTEAQLVEKLLIGETTIYRKAKNIIYNLVDLANAPINMGA